MFVSELRSLSEFCNFGGSLDVMIRDCLVCGINDDGMQKWLLSEPGLTYAKAVEISQGIEMAAQNVKDIKGRAETSNRVQPHGGQEVHALSGAGSRKPPPTCFRCGNTGHLAQSCRVSRVVVCHRCKKRGHLQRACRSQPSGPNKGKEGRGVKRVVEEELEDFPLYQVRLHGTHKSPPIVVKISVDDCLINMELDTGASMSIMSEHTFKGLWPGRSLLSTDVRLQSYSKEPIVLLCQLRLQGTMYPWLLWRAQALVSWVETGYVESSWTGNRYTMCTLMGCRQFWIDTKKCSKRGLVL